MEKFNFFNDFRTEGGAFHNCTKNKKKPQRKIFGNKDAKIGHFHHFPEMKAGSASMMNVGCCVQNCFGRNY